MKIKRNKFRINVNNKKKKKNNKNLYLEPNKEYQVSQNQQKTRIQRNRRTNRLKIIYNNNKIKM